MNGTSAGVPGTRTVNVSIVVPPPPDFTLTANPPTLTLTQGGTGKITFTMTALNGWNSPTTLSIPAIPNVTAAPTTGPFPGTGGSIDVFFTASANAPNGSIPFTATASTSQLALVITRSANATIVIQPPPDFSLSVTPLALRLLQGDTGPVTVTANPLYGFTGAVDVVAPSVPGLTFNPATFTLAAGASRRRAGHGRPGLRARHDDADVLGDVQGAPGREDGELLAHRRPASRLQPDASSRRARRSRPSGRRRSR